MVRICKLTRAFDQFMWLCSACIQEMKKQGYDVEVRGEVDQPCDRRGEASHK